MDGPNSAFEHALPRSLCPGVAAAAALGFQPSLRDGARLRADPGAETLVITHIFWRFAPNPPLGPRRTRERSTSAPKARLYTSLGQRPRKGAREEDEG
jgi:hypothetical protein